MRPLKVSWGLLGQQTRRGGGFDPVGELVEHCCGEFLVGGLVDRGQVALAIGLAVEVLGVDIVEEPPAGLGLLQVVDLDEERYLADGEALDPDRVVGQFDESLQRRVLVVGRAVGDDDQDDGLLGLLDLAHDDVERCGQIGGSHVVAVPDLAVDDVTVVVEVDLDGTANTVIERDDRDLAVLVHLQGEAQCALDDLLDVAVAVVRTHRPGMIQDEHHVRAQTRQAGVRQTLADLLVGLGEAGRGSLGEGDSWAVTLGEDDGSCGLHVGVDDRGRLTTSEHCSSMVVVAYQLR